MASSEESRLALLPVIRSLNPWRCRRLTNNFPAGKILDIVKKQIARMAVDGVHGADNFIVIFHGGQPFISRPMGRGRGFSIKSRTLLEL